MKMPRFLLLAVLATPALVLSTLGQEERDRTRTRTEFMRKKLEFSKGLVEGLALEDYNLIAKNARGLRAMSRAAEWEVPTIPDVENYLHFSAEFQRIADDLIKKAAAKNIDGATLDYVRLTTNCVNCHKYLRSARH